MRCLWQNLRYSLRALRKNPGFTTVAILSLALGIGANVAIFTLINALLLRELPVPRPERLVELSLVRLGHKGTFSYPIFRELDRGQRVFSAFIGWSGPWQSNVEVNGVLAQNRLCSATGNYYSELGATPLLGRLLTLEDVDPHAGSTSQVAVIGYEFWQRASVAHLLSLGSKCALKARPSPLLASPESGLPVLLQASRPTSQFLSLSCLSSSLVWVALIIGRRFGLKSRVG